MLCFYPLSTANLYIDECSTYLNTSKKIPQNKDERQGGVIKRNILKARESTFILETIMQLSYPFD